MYDTNEWNYPDAAWDYTEMMEWYSEDDDGFSMNETYVSIYYIQRSLRGLYFDAKGCYRAKRLLI